MNTITIQNGSRQVLITQHDQWSRWDTDGRKWVSARLYLNNGETAGHQCWKGKTVDGARRWAFRILAN